MMAEKQYDKLFKWTSFSGLFVRLVKKLSDFSRSNGVNVLWKRGMTTTITSRNNNSPNDNKKNNNNNNTNRAHTRAFFGLVLFSVERNVCANLHFGLYACWNTYSFVHSSNDIMIDIISHLSPSSLLSIHRWYSNYCVVAGTEYNLHEFLTCVFTIHNNEFA